MTENTVTDVGFWHLLAHSDPIVKLAILTLLAFSIASWAIIFYKYKQVKKAQSDSQNFWGTFSKAKSMQDLGQVTRSGPLYEIYATAQDWKSRLKGRNRGNAIAQKLAQTREEEIYKLEQYTSFLATTASTAPFIGLFGTVWGILTAFWAIGKAGSSSLATVGPYISEALIATAVGLAAAIPAVIAYNHFVHRTKVLVKMMDLFLDDLVLKLEDEAA